MTNTRICYTYRDGDNFKVAADVVLPGTLSDAVKQDLLAHCNTEDTESPLFIPGQVGLKDLQDSFVDPSRWEEDRDHPWHEIDTIEDTEMSVLPEDREEIPMTATEFSEAFLTTTWDPAWKPEFYEEMKVRAEDETTPEF